MAIKIKKLFWYPGPTSKFNNMVNFDCADTPFGRYTAWYSDGALWIPQRGEYSRHGTVEAAKEAAQAHLEEGIARLLEGDE